ncbi:methionine synthase [Moorella thermoacetica]|uniref:Methionine synthase n=3 Tax=Neomoorella thermoacetica TaxID=1525 RepID=A0A1D7XAT4_NEOTH|nr:methionine synthase [Moorella thermoacetica]AKX96727.1 methionine synthase [Moorella thermoacetica]AOQ24040.1 Methionine synthase [Moorella thermoacetica]OIQ12992.1 methionine synthase [Moorella thermoacetica]OIQ57897.1 methionine synthase [Moorella thermoacetica]
MVPVPRRQVPVKLPVAYFLIYTKNLEVDRMSLLAQAMGKLEEKRVLELVSHSLAVGQPPLAIVEECRRGLNIVGELYARGEYFLSDLVMSAEIFQEALKLIEPFLKVPLADRQEPAEADIVFGTVEGDIHDIGKNITISLLRCEGFRVYDAGVDIPPDVFLTLIQKTGARVLGLSALLTSSFEAMRRTVHLMHLVESMAPVKVLIGGLVNERVCQYVGADAWVREAGEGVAICRRWLRHERAARIATDVN